MNAINILCDADLRNTNDVMHSFASTVKIEELDFSKSVLGRFIEELYKKIGEQNE